MVTKHTPIILFREVVRDSFPLPFIEVSAGRPKPNKTNKDTVEWTVVNHTTQDIEVAVVDFYSEKGGTPFPSGFVPEPSGTVAKKAGGVPGIGTIGKIKDATAAVKGSIEANGDPGIYKYTVLARIIPAVGGPGPWILVRDPEMELEP